VAIVWQVTVQPKEPDRRPSLKEGVRDVLEIMWCAFTYILGVMSGGIVIGLAMIFAGFAFTAIGLESFTIRWTAGMLISLVALVAFERWRSRR
jgi:hypothetical protein